MQYQLINAAVEPTFRSATPYLVFIADFRQPIFGMKDCFNSQPVSPNPADTPMKRKLTDYGHLFGNAVEKAGLEASDRKPELAGRIKE